MTLRRSERCPLAFPRVDARFQAHGGKGLRPGPPRRTSGLGEGRWPALALLRGAHEQGAGGGRSPARPRRDWLPFSNPVLPRLTGNQPVRGRTPRPFGEGGGGQHFSDTKATAQRGRDIPPLRHTSCSLVILGQSWCTWRMAVCKGRHITVVKNEKSPSNGLVRTRGGGGGGHQPREPLFLRALLPAAPRGCARSPRPHPPVFPLQDKIPNPALQDRMKAVSAMTNTKSLFGPSPEKSGSHFVFISSFFAQDTRGTAGMWTAESPPLVGPPLGRVRASVRQGRPGARPHRVGSWTLCAHTFPPCFPVQRVIFGKNTRRIKTPGLFSSLSKNMYEKLRMLVPVRFLLSVCFGSLKNQTATWLWFLGGH